MRAVERRFFARPEPPDQLDRLLEARLGLGAEDAGRVELELPVPEPDPELESAARHRVDRRSLLGDVERVEQREEDHRRPEREVRDGGRQAREERERLEELVVAGEEVLAGPERLEPRRGSGLDEARVGPNGLRRRKVGGRLGELDA